MAGSRQIEVLLEDRTPHKWIVPLAEDDFQAFFSKGSQSVRKVFGDGSFFSPMLFGKFFDPSDAFPLWDFEADVLLSILRASGHNQVDWSLNDKEYVLKAELPGVGEDCVQVCVEKGKILEISGQWKQQSEGKARNWKSGHWWEQGFVRRIELPENADWRKTELVQLAKVMVPNDQEEYLQFCKMNHTTYDEHNKSLQGTESQDHINEQDYAQKYYRKCVDYKGQKEF